MLRFNPTPYLAAIAIAAYLGYQAGMNRVLRDLGIVEADFVDEQRAAAAEGRQ